MSGPTPLLRVEDLQTHFFTDDGVVRAVDGVSFEVARGRDARRRRRVGQRQERDGALDPAPDPEPPGRIVGGEHPVQGARTCSALPRAEMRAIRGKEISMIFQEPMTSLNPVFTCGEQIIEAIVLHERVDRARGARARDRDAASWSASRRPSSASTSIRTSCRAACASA